MPVVTGPTSPAATATMTSSSRRTPAARSPRATSACPRESRPNTSRSLSWLCCAMPSMSPANVYACSASPRASASRNGGIRRKPRAAHVGSAPSSTRSARPNQPPGARPRRAAQTRVRPRTDSAARSGSPRRTHSTWARSQARALSSSRPVSWAETARRSRSSAAVTSPSVSSVYASSQAWRANASRPSSLARDTPTFFRWSGDRRYGYEPDAGWSWLMSPRRRSQRRASRWLPQPVHRQGRSRSPRTRRLGPTPSCRSPRARRPR